MKKNLLFPALSIFSMLSLNAQVNNTNAKYGYSVSVPADWHVYAEIKDDPENNMSLLDWGLPKVYSELEKHDIENAVSIIAYNRSDIKSLEDLVKFEFDRISSVLVSKKKLDDKTNASYEIITKRNNVSYKTKSVYIFKNNIGYALNFTATPGTYDKNIGKFNDFAGKVVFSVPKEDKTSAVTAATGNLRFDGLYVAKTASVKIGDTQTEIYNYIRFYSDGSVYTQSVSGYFPDKVIKWLGKSGRFERSGTYTVTGSEIKFTVNNDKSPDKELEGPMADSYSGKLTDENKLFLQVKLNTSALKDFWFEFVKAE